MVIHEALSTFPAAEQEALRAYYEGESSLEEAALRVPGGLAAFSQLREQLYEAVRLGGLQNAAQTAAAAGSSEQLPESVPQRAMAATNTAR